MKKIILILIVLISSAAYCEVTRKTITNSDDSYRITYFDNGKEIAVETYDNNDELLKLTGKIPDGKVSEYYQSGKLKGTWFFKSGKREGISVRFYESGNIRREIIYKEGEHEGAYKKYYENGKLKEHAVYLNDKLNGAKIVYYENGRIQEEIDYKDGIVNGAYKVYYQDGIIKQDSNYKDGLFNGTFKLYYSNGQIEEKGTYKEGKIDGICKDFYKNGKPKSEVHYKNGKKKSTKIWYKDGKLMYEKSKNEGLYLFVGLVIMILPIYLIGRLIRKKIKANKRLLNDDEKLVLLGLIYGKSISREELIKLPEFIIISILDVYFNCIRHAKTNDKEIFREILKGFGYDDGYINYTLQNSKNTLEDIILEKIKSEFPNNKIDTEKIRYLMIGYQEITCKMKNREITIIKRHKMPLHDKDFKDPWIAVILSYLFSGLGQFYAGFLKKGLLFMILDFVLLCLIQYSSLSRPFFSMT